MHTGRTTPHTNRRTSRADDAGFTLVELLIVIVILGILATVTVFAVRGITDSGQENAEAADLRSIQSATEAYYAQNGSYPDEATLVADGYMSDDSALHDVSVDGSTGALTITNVRTGASETISASSGSTATTLAPEPDNVVQTASFAGFDAHRYGQGAKTLVVLANADGQQEVDYLNWVASNPPIPDTQFIFVYDTAMYDTTNVEIALAQGATAWVAQYHDPLGFGHWSSPNGPVVPLWYLRGINGGGSAQARTPGLTNVIQWDDNGAIQPYVVDFFNNNY